MSPHTPVFRTPVFIEIALHYWTTPGDHPMVQAGTHRMYEEIAEFMVQAGMLTKSEKLGVLYESTEALGVYIGALCEVPLPVQRWVIPTVTHET